jgi:hypothetical protein
MYEIKFFVDLLMTAQLEDSCTEISLLHFKPRIAKKVTFQIPQIANNA